MFLEITESIQLEFEIIGEGVFNLRVANIIDTVYIILIPPRRIPPFFSSIWLFGSNITLMPPLPLVQPEYFQSAKSNFTRLVKIPLRQTISRKKSHITLIPPPFLGEKSFRSLYHANPPPILIGQKWLRGGISMISTLVVSFLQVYIPIYIIFLLLINRTLLSKENSQVLSIFSSETFVGHS